MKRSLLRAGKYAFVVLVVAFLSVQYTSSAQDMRPVKANEKTITEHKKKKKHKRHTEIKNGSDDDKKLREIKAGKEKKKFKK